MPWSSLLGVFAMISSSADASTFRQITLPELLSDSVAVVQVRVVSTHSAWTLSESSDLRTWADLEVVRSLDGDLKAGDTLTVAELGGTVDDYTVQAIGFPQFVDGDELVVFLTHWTGDSHDWRVAGYAQGFYQVVHRPDGDALVAGRLQGTRPGREDVIERLLPHLTKVDALASTIHDIRR
ncbi:MAG: hypothetical protein H6735_28240 [Alphaproteobacteria bacterium]|nr:hypothetical protein [Alphaproteobacteria bacterium]